LGNLYVVEKPSKNRASMWLLDTYFRRWHTWEFVRSKTQVGVLFKSWWNGGERDTNGHLLCFMY
jgi:hypothetical protein